MELRDFLIEAKINTYASGGEGGEKAYPDGCKEFVYEKSGYKYQDRYFGFSPFIGEEIVWRNGSPIWGMNYVSRIVSNEVDYSSVYSFLKEALKNISAERPFRGPENFTKGDFLYENESSGNIEKFDGWEAIFLKNNKVYELKYSGGIINKYENRSYWQHAIYGEDAGSAR